MKILSFLFIATTMLFSFNAFTPEHTDPVKEEVANCSAGCFFSSCSIDSGSGGNGTVCSCYWGFAICATVDVSAVAPEINQPDGQAGNLNTYINLVKSFESEEARMVASIASNLQNLLKGGTEEIDANIYSSLVKDHTAAVENLPEDELALVLEFLEH